MNQKDKRFVIQEHITAEDVHWDFMLESGDILQTYRLDKSPNKVLHRAVNATKIFNHPLKFLTYQGPVNKGRGNVRIVETGTYKTIRHEHNQIKLNLSGQILKGHFTLTHIKDDNWRFIKCISKKPDRKAVNKMIKLFSFALTLLTVTKEAFCAAGAIINSHLLFLLAGSEILRLQD
jgi:hypothetical protein